MSMEEGSPRGKHNPRRKAEQRLRAISTRVRVERKDHVRQGPKTQSAEPYEGGKQPEGCCVDTSSGAQGGSLSSCADPSLSGIALYQWLSGLQGGGARSAPQRGAPSSPRKNSFSKPEPGTSVFPTELSGPSFKLRRRLYSPDPGRRETSLVGHCPFWTAPTPAPISVTKRPFQQIPNPLHLGSPSLQTSLSERYGGTGGGEV
ncbi:hypothetical protein NN561_013569 [Cricetulus griseus]